jgi:hypothetical protein
MKITHTGKQNKNINKINGYLLVSRCSVISIELILILILFFFFIIEACSWRSDSTRCYPGVCTNEIVETCNCTSGFGGYQCDTSKVL